MKGDRQYQRAARARGLNAGQAQQLETTRGLTAEGLRDIPEAALQRAVRRLEYPDLARAREAFRWLQARDERGLVPPNALPNAVRQLDSARTRAATQPRVAGVPTGQQLEAGALLPPLAGLHPDHRGWVSLGPGNIGGRTRAIVVHPTRPATIWAASVGGGVWRTDNGGASWAPVDDFMANLVVCCLAMGPTNSDVIYAGTGEGFSNLDALRGAGVFRTLDGATWQQLPATTGPDFRAVNRLAISSDGQVVLAATPAGLFRTADPDRLNWASVLSAQLADVDFHPTDSARAIAGGLRNGEAYLSTDGGLTWTAATHASPWQGRVEVTYAAADPSIVYASIQMTAGEIWRSTNGGKSYTRRKSLTPDGRPSRYLGDQGWYGNVIWAGDPTDANLLVTGGVDLWKSTDGGQTLVDVSTWWDPASAHADHHFIVAHPDYDGLNNKTVFFGNDGGIHKTDDLATLGNNPLPPRKHGWATLVKTYGVTQFYGAAGNPTSGTIIGGSQDNGTLRFTPGQGTDGWTAMFGGDGGWCAADPIDPDVFYGEYVFLNIHRSTDGGASADFISGQFWNGFEWAWKPVPFRIPDAKNQQALFIAPFVLDPNEPNRLLAGGLSLWRTDDAKAPNSDTSGPSWTAIKLSAGRFISALAVARGNSDLIWAGHEDGQVFKTQNGTATNPVWQQVDQGGPSPLAQNRYCTGLTIDPRDHQTGYATFGGHTRGNVWKTADGGATWSNLGNALPEVPARALAIHPDKSHFLYLGTEIGVFASENGGATWSPTNEGPTNCSVDDLFWMDKTLVCATHGRGMFRIDLAGV